MGRDVLLVSQPGRFWLCVYPKKEDHKRTWIGGPDVWDLRTENGSQSCGNQWFAIPIRSILFVFEGKVLDMIRLYATEGLPPGCQDISYH